MAKVTVNLKTAKKFKIDDADALNIGTSTVKEMKKLISVGSSPVRGVGRFKPYAAQRSSAVSDYPRGKKNIRPVNLFLNGWYLGFLNWWFSRKKQYIGVGFSGAEGVFRQSPKKVIDFFETHNEGSQEPDVPRRKHLPNVNGDRFSVSVERVYKKEFQRAVDKAVRLMNKKNK